MHPPLDDLEFLNDLINQPEPERSPRSKKLRDIRDQDHWFKLQHVHFCWDCHSFNVDMSEFKCLDCGSESLQVGGNCSQGENCLGILYDPDGSKGPTRVTAIVNGVEMCRFDFLDGLAYKPD